MSNFKLLFSMATLLSAIRLTIPLAFGALGSTITEKSGVINLGVEGIMLMGSFAAVVGAHYSGSAFIGFLSAIVMGLLMGLIYAVLVLKFKANQSVSGIGLNILATGLTLVLNRAIWSTEGMSGPVAQVPTFSVPLLSDIPYVGRLFANQSPYLLLLIIAVLITSWYINRTKKGLRLRAIGQNDQAAETVGIPVVRYRYWAIVVSCVLFSVGGSYLSIVQNDRFVENMVAGRGFMAIAANIFGRQTALGSLGASFIFAYAQSLRINLNLAVPDQFVQMLPYALTLLVLILIGVRDMVKKKAK